MIWFMSRRLVLAGHNVKFVCVDALCPKEQCFSHVGMCFCLSELNLKLTDDKCLAQDRKNYCKFENFCGFIFAKLRGCGILRK